MARPRRLERVHHLGRVVHLRRWKLRRDRRD